MSSMKKISNSTLDELLNTLNKFNSIQYVAYRTGSKIKFIQKHFNVDKLPIEILDGIMLKHQLTSTENAVCLTPAELDSLLEDIFFFISQQQSHLQEFSSSSNELSCILLRILEKDGGAELLGVKIMLAVLCGSKPSDKYSYLFSQLADHNSVLTPRRLELLLQRLVLLTQFIGEGTAFGKALIPGTVSSCFDGLSRGGLGVSQQAFIDWLSRDPQLLVWISTLHRLHLADTVTHDVKCSVCKCSKMVGLRYRCLRCLTYNLCQECFFTGKLSQKHKKKHPVQEYCYQSTRKQTVRALLTTLRNKLRRSGWKLQYLPVEQRQSYIQESTLQLNQLEETTMTLCASSGVSVKDLEAILKELEEHSRRLLQYVEFVDAPTVKRFLLSHREMMEKQVDRLRILKKQLSSRSKEGNWGAGSNSTPFAKKSALSVHSGVSLHSAGFSPIASDSRLSPALTWDQYDIGGPQLNTFLVQGPEDPRILTCQWNPDSSSSSCDELMIPQGYSWLQDTRGNSKKETCTENAGDIQAMHDDLDQILAKLQKLLSHHDGVEHEAESSAKDQKPDPIEEILDRI